MSYNPFSLEKKNILVTGASSGIGRSIAIECSKMGAHIILVARNINRLNETLELLEGEGHLIVPVDLTKEEDIINLINRIPQLNGCVHCAGIPQMSPISYFKRDDIKSLFDVNTFAPMILTSLLIKKKKILKGSSIVFISAISGVYIGTTGDTAYGASKGAINGFIKGASLELAPKNIRVNGITPGLVPSPILELSNKIFNEEHHISVAIEKYPLKRLGKPEDIAYGAIYLLSDAANWVTGTNLIIDGGYIIN